MPSSSYFNRLRKLAQEHAKYKWHNGREVRARGRLRPCKDARNDVSGPSDIPALKGPECLIGSVKFQTFEASEVSTQVLGCGRLTNRPCVIEYSDRVAVAKMKTHSERLNDWQSEIL
jgi:hypothetical protein